MLHLAGPLASQDFIAPIWAMVMLPPRAAKIVNRVTARETSWLRTVISLFTGSFAEDPITISHPQRKVP
jgi:hypothetical protein